jgi:hypothetical protein
MLMVDIFLVGLPLHLAALGAAGRYVARLTSVRPRRRRRVWPAYAGHRFRSLASLTETALRLFSLGR